MHRFGKLISAALVLVCLSGAPARADTPTAGTSLADDFQLLIGNWQETTKNLEIKISIQDQAIQISISGMRGEQGFTGAGVGRLSGVKEDDRGRYLELEPLTARSTGLPQRIYYRLDGSICEFQYYDNGNRQNQYRPLCRSKSQK